MKKQFMKRMMATTMAVGVIGTSVFGNRIAYASTAHSNAGSTMKLMETENETYTSFEVGTTQNFKLAGTQKVAYFKFTTDSTDSFYTFTTNMNGTSTTRSHTFVYSGLELLNEQKVVDTWTNPGDTNQQLLAKKLKPNTTYYVMVNIEDDDESAEGSVIVNQCVDDLGDTIDAAAEIKTGVAGTGYINDGTDVDFLKYTTDATDSFYYLDASVVGTEGRVHFAVYNSPELLNTGCVWKGWVDHGTNFFVDLSKKLEPNKTYYIQMRVEHEITVENQLKYSVTITQYPDDMKDTVQDAKSIETGQAGTGILQNREDVDFFKYTTDATDSFYSLDASVVGTEGRIHFAVYNTPELLDTGCVWKGWVDHGTNLFVNLEKKLEPNKTYYIQMRVEHEITPENQLNYSVTIKQYKDDVKDTVAEAKKITVDKTYSYTLQNETDVDWYQVDTTNYTDYLVHFQNTAKEGDIEIKIYSDKDGIKEVYSRRIGGKSAVSGQDKKIKLTPYKTYYIKVSGNVASYKVGLNPEGPTNAKIKNEKGTKKRVTVSWSKVNKANGYEVWKATKNGNFKKVKTFNSAKIVKWTDTSVKKGTTYKYKIRAYAKKGGKTYYSAFSAVKSIKVK